MDTRADVVLFGNSVLLEGLGMSLSNDLGLYVVQVDNHTSGLEERLNSLEPDLIVVDLDTPRLSAVFSLLRQRPGTLFMGIDHVSSEVIVLKSNLYPIHSMKEFYQLTQMELGCEVRMQEGGKSFAETSSQVEAH
jgi:hypothetical protein